MNTPESSPISVSSAHRWRFFRAGGVDHVAFRNGADIANLSDLDLKLWLALAMPTRGIEFDPASLDFIDTNKDGRIRPDELLAAIAWARNAFVSLDPLIQGGDSVELANIKDCHRAMAAVLGVILKLPPVKQVLASEQLKSRYLETLIGYTRH